MISRIKIESEKLHFFQLLDVASAQNLPSFHQFVLHVAALEKPSGLQALELCRLLYAEDLTEYT